MRTSLIRRSILLLSLASFGPSWAAAQSQPSAQPASGPAQPLATLSGDGLTMIVREASGTGAMAGDIIFGGATYKFTAQRTTTADTDTVKGTFLAGGQSFDFEARQKRGDPKVAFTSGGQTYMLQGPAAANPLAKPDQPANPLATPPAPAPAANPAVAPALFMLVGDGLTVRVRTLSDDETSMSGDLTLDGATYPFTAQISYDDNDSEVVKGNFRAGSEDVQFSTVQDENDNTVATVRGRRYRLQEAPAAEEPAPAAQVNPADPRVSPGPGGPSAAMPGEIRLRKAEFTDINMGVVAYTMLIPEGWQAEGHIEWSNEQTPYPQTIISVTGPDQSHIAFHPAMKFSYSEMTPGATFGGPTGTAPPQNLGEWIVSLITQSNTRVTNVRLVSDQRDSAAEQVMAAQLQSQGGAQGAEWQSHLVTITFNMGGVPFTEEINVNYAKNAWTHTQNMNMMTWALFTNSDVSAPTASFASTKPLLYASAQSLRSVPKWWTQQQQLIMDITKNNFKIGMEEIKRRGQYYDQMSDANMADWKKQYAAGAGDSQQNDRINSIYEVEDFKDTDGLGVKLPIHYQNYYSDGNGHYLMTNSTMAEPGSEWTPIEQVK